MGNDLPDQFASVGAIPGPFDRSFWLVILIASAVIIPRSVLIARAHSESYDDGYHLTRGLAYLSRGLAESGLILNDPPLGEGLVALPRLVATLGGNRPPVPGSHGLRPGPEGLAMLTAAWKAILFLPLIGVIFYWCRSIYGLRSAWLAAVLLMVEPNFAAHVPIPALDVLGAEGIVLACFLAWRYFERPTSGRLAANGMGIAAALMLKHTAVILPMVILAMAGLWWVIKPWQERQVWEAWRASLPARREAMAQMALAALASLWALSLFDVSSPGPGIDVPCPAGAYVGSFLAAIVHGAIGHEAYLLGEGGKMGWWYYFPVVASYKVPLGVGVVLLLAVLSLRRTSPRWAEWGLALPMVAWTLFLMSTKVNIGFRHFLPAYAFILALAARCVVRAGRVVTVAAWCAVAATGVHAAMFHPDYLCYINFPRHKPHLAISDSNVDWGQALKQVRRWVDDHPADDRPVYLRYFGTGDVNSYLGDRVIALGEEDPPPTGGLLIISPVYEVGLYDRRDAYTVLRSCEPIDMIGHCLLVYDLDRLGGGHPFRWRLPRGE